MIVGAVAGEPRRGPGTSAIPAATGLLTYQFSSPTGVFRGRAPTSVEGSAARG
jgi:hypothetical protein